MRLLAACVLGSTTVMGFLSSAQADADLLTDAMGPREIAMGDARRAEATGGLSASLNPAGLPLTRELVFEGGYGYRATDKASLVNLTACDSTNRAPGCFYYRYAGGRPDDDMPGHQRTHVAGLTLARAVNSRAMVGVASKYVNAKGAAMDGSEDRSGFNWDAGLAVRLTDTLNLGVVGYNLFGTSNLAIARSVATGIAMRPAPQLSVGFDALWNLDTPGKTGRYGGGGEYFITTEGGQSGYPLRAGVVHDVTTGTYLSAGLGMSTTKFAVDIGGRRQVKNGDELEIVASLRVFGPR
jgi:hypothetical protein